MLDHADKPKEYADKPKEYKDGRLPITERVLGAEHPEALTTVPTSPTGLSARVSASLPTCQVG